MVGSVRSRFLLTAAAGAAGIWWWRTHPSACPYAARLVVDLPHPLITRARLREALAPEPGERILEVGPGTGYYSLPLAGWLGPDGRLDILDIQPEMLEHTVRRTRKRGLGNVHPAEADAQALPYPDATFDAAYLTVMLGEIPDQEAALRELRRVLKPEGRLVVGEIFLDFHMVTFGALRGRAERAGLRLERRVGGPLGFFARFAPASA
jgi:SAM-dependent methyltransferase